MTYTAAEIIDAIETYVDEHGGDWCEWYIGIAADAEDRLFSDHKVCKKEDDWIRKKARTSRIARDVEAYLIEKHDAHGGPRGGDENTRTVYAYRITFYTVE